MAILESKYNIANGGPAPEKITDAIYAKTQTIQEYKISDAPESQVDLNKFGHYTIENMAVEVIDSVDDYAELMQQILILIKSVHYLRAVLQMRFDGMSAYLVLTLNEF